MLTQLSTDCELVVADIDNELNKTTTLDDGISQSNYSKIVTPSTFFSPTLGGTEMMFSTEFKLLLSVLLWWKDSIQLKPTVLNLY